MLQYVKRESIAIKKKKKRKKMFYVKKYAAFYFNLYMGVITYSR